MATNGFKHGDDVRVVGAGLDGAAINEYRRTIQARHAHQQARHVFVTSADGDDAVMPHTAGHGLHAVGDDLPGNQRILHALCAHGNPIGNSQNVVDDALTTRVVSPLVDVFCQLIDVHIAGRHHAPGRSDADLGFFEVTIFETDCPQHGTAWCLLHAINNN